MDREATSPQLTSRRLKTKHQQDSSNWAVSREYWWKGGLGRGVGEKENKECRKGAERSLERTWPRAPPFVMRFPQNKITFITTTHSTKTYFENGPWEFSSNGRNSSEAWKREWPSHDWYKLCILLFGSGNGAKFYANRKANSSKTKAIMLQKADLILERI